MPMEAWIETEGGAHAAEDAPTEVGICCGDPSGRAAESSSVRGTLPFSERCFPAGARACAADP